MMGKEFIRLIRKIGKRKGVLVSSMPEQGKGSHGTLYFGDKITVVKNKMKEIGRGLFLAMLAQLGLTKDDLD